MKERVVRLRIPEVLYKKYKVFCAENDLSMPKQTAELIRECLKIDPDNKSRMEKSCL